jgi:3-oxoacyl-(acyl-carrier-protein) synthase
MTPLFIAGRGAVSPAGWGVDPLWEVMARGTSVPIQLQEHPGWPRPLPIRPVPAPPAQPALFAHPRLRRTSPIGRYCLAAAVEALGGESAARAAADGLGVIVCVTAGGVNYTRRFYDETLRDPATASPLLFPETVFNAPASHLAAWLGSTGESATLVGDEGTFLQGLALAADWLTRGVAQTVVVVGAEELDGLVAGAMNLFARGAVHAAGAGAVWLRQAPAAGTPAVLLERISDAFSYSRRQPPEQAAQAMRRQLPGGMDGEWLVLSARGHRRLDRAEHAAWADWPGPRVAPLSLVGAAFNAAAAWQAVLACEAVRRGAAPAATGSVVGTNQQAVGARLVAAEARSPHAGA